MKRDVLVRWLFGRWLFGRWMVAALIALLTLASAPALPRAAAQTETGAICVTAFADLNGNGMRDETETPLAGVNVNLSTGGAIIATHVTTEGEDQYCFENLLPGTYTVTFTDSPTYRTTTAAEGTFNLAAGQRLTITDFGGVPIPAAPAGSAATDEAVAVDVDDADEDEPLESSARLLLSSAGALVVMLFMVGVGAILIGVMGFNLRRRRPRRPEDAPPPPAEIQPPGA